MPQNTPNYNSNIHFGPPGYPGGASGAQNIKIAVPGGYLKDRIWVLWNFCPIFGYLTLFGWLKLDILTLVVYHTPLPGGADLTVSLTVKYPGGFYDFPKERPNLRDICRERM